jgi:hypothetical protein
MKKKRKGGVYGLAGVGPVGSNVIAKRCRPDKGTVERAVYEHVFPRLPTAPLNYYGSVEENGGKWLWLFLEDVGAERLKPDNELHCTLAARCVGEMQAAIGRSGLPDSIPTRSAGSYRGCIQSILRDVPELRERAFIDRKGRETLERIAERCSTLESRWNDVETWCASIPAAFSHNDCLPKNVHIRRTGSGPSVAMFDWGGAGWAPAGGDLGLLALPHRGPPADEPDYAAYMSAVSDRWPGLELDSVRQAADLGQLFWALKVISRELPQLDSAWREPHQTLMRLEIYERALVRSLTAVDACSGRRLRDGV